MNFLNSKHDNLAWRDPVVGQPVVLWSGARESNEVNDLGPLREVLSIIQQVQVITYFDGVLDDLHLLC